MRKFNAFQLKQFLENRYCRGVEMVFTVSPEGVVYGLAVFEIPKRYVLKAILSYETKGVMFKSHDSSRKEA